jgi:cytochrome c-type biogenesis protein CcmH
MTLWFLFAPMTLAAIFAVLWPPGRGGRPKAAGNEAGVYRDEGLKALGLDG